MQIERITHNPAVMGGKPCIRGLRVTVGIILGLLASGKSRERILQAYPYNMRHPWATFFCLFFLPGLSRAQDVPERLLPASTQIYVRWDGLEAHHAAFSKTALAKTLNGETGVFLAGLFMQIQDNVDTLITSQKLLSGTPPELLQRIQGDAGELTKIFPLLARHGFILAVELRKLQPFDAQMTLIIPDAGSNPGPVFGVLRLLAALANAELKERKQMGRLIYQWDIGPANVSAWVEGRHVVVVAGIEKAENVIQRMTGLQNRLPDNPLYKKLLAFKSFETGGRGFIDGAALAKLAQTTNQGVAKLVRDLGLDGIKSLTFFTGYDGPASRSVLELETVGPRRGLLRLAGGKPFKLTDLPPLPADVVSWYMTSLDLGMVYDVARQTLETVASADAAAQVKDAFNHIDNVLGISVRKDLLADQGDKIAVYTSPGDGFLTFGQAFLFKVKDAKKLQKSLDQAIKGLGKSFGLDVSVKKKTYHGVAIREVHARQQGFIFVPTYAIVNDWLVVGYFPQSVRGAILRAQGKLPVWKPNPRVQATLDKLPKEFISISVSDPRPGIKQLLTLAPLAVGFLNSLGSGIQFDVGLLPNAHEATRHLFPNVSVASDNGSVLRFESEASLDLPIGLGGIDTYVILLLLSYAGALF